MGILAPVWKRRVNRVLGAVTGYQLQRADSKQARQPRKPEPPARARAGTKDPQTIAREWDAYAGRRRTKPRVGDVWSNPQQIGLDVAGAGDVLPYLDRTVFSPFLGTCEVMLEIGPGAGRFTEILLPKCERLIAVDTSETMLNLLRERFEGDDRVEYYRSRGRGMKGIAGESVDNAFSYGVFVHLQHWDIFNYLSELSRVLKPGGKAVIQHSNTFSDRGWKRFMREVPRQVNRHKLYTTFVVNSPELMREFVTRAGLECVDTLTDVVRRDCITLIQKPVVRVASDA